jgi:cysteine synthase
MIYDFTSITAKLGFAGKLYVWRDFQNKKFNIVRELLNVENLSVGQTVVEASTGSMAKALAAFAAEKGLRAVIFGNAQLAQDLPLGAELISPEITAQSVPRLVQYAALAKEYAEEHEYYYLGQFERQRHWQLYKERLGLELNAISGAIDFYIDNVGTGATFRGFGEALRDKYGGIELYASAGDLIVHSKFLTGFEFNVIERNTDKVFLDERTEIRKALDAELSAIVGKGRYEKSVGNLLNAVLLLRNNPNKTVFTTIGD